MQIWKRGKKNAGWKIRPTKSLASLGQTGLRRFLQERMELRKSKQCIWVVFESNDLIELRRIGMMLFGSTLNTASFAAESEVVLSAIQAQNDLLRNCASTDLVRGTLRRNRNSVEPISTRVPMRLAVRID